MNYVFSIINPYGLGILTEILNALELPLVLVMHGSGTATGSMLGRLGMESRERRVVMTVADEEQTNELIEKQRQRLYIDAPGNGVVIAIPIKSVGGGKTLAWMSGNRPVKRQKPNLDPDHELIVVIANMGMTDVVMDAARAAGASGGTTLHAKGTGAKDAEKFFSVSLAQEKELLLIVSDADKKAAIMQSILQDAGPDSEAGAIAFSLPVTALAGFSRSEPVESDDNADATE